MFLPTNSWWKIMIIAVITQHFTTYIINILSLVLFGNRNNTWETTCVRESNKTTDQN